MERDSVYSFITPQSSKPFKYFKYCFASRKGEIFCWNPIFAPIPNRCLRDGSQGFGKKGI